MNAKRRTSALVVFLLGLTTFASCNEDPTGGEMRQPGELTASLVSPNGDEGSALLEVASGTVLDVTAVEPYVHVFRVGSNPARIVVLRMEPGEIAFRLTTDDVNQPPELRVVDVGGPDDQLRSSLAGYSVSLGGGTGS